MCRNREKPSIYAFAQARVTASRVISRGRWGYGSVQWAWFTTIMTMVIGMYEYKWSSVFWKHAAYLPYMVLSERWPLRCLVIRFWRGFSRNNRILSPAPKLIWLGDSSGQKILRRHPAVSLKSLIGNKFLPSSLLDFVLLSSYSLVRKPPPSLFVEQWPNLVINVA